MNAEYWIEKLRLEPHPEGGYFRQTYRADMTLPQAALPLGFVGARVASTAIYFLLVGEKFSAFHRLRSDEVWHFYDGSPLVVHVIETEVELVFSVWIQEKGEKIGVSQFLSFNADSIEDVELPQVAVQANKVGIFCQLV